MKNVIRILCLVLTVGAASNAVAARWFVGVIGGVNFADLTEVDETSMNSGFQGGGFVGADFSEGVGGRVEILYTQKGTARNVNPEFGGQDSTVKLDYVDFPVLLVGHLRRSPTSALSAFGGPSIGINLSGEDESEDGTIVDLDIEPVEVALVVGFDFEHIRESLTVFLDARVSIGLTGVLENAASEYDGVKNIGLGILLGLKFPLGGKV